MNRREKMAGGVGLALVLGLAAAVAIGSAAPAAASETPRPPVPIQPPRPAPSPSPRPTPTPAPSGNGGGGGGGGGSLAAGDGARFALAHRGTRDELIVSAWRAGLLRMPSSLPVRVSPRLVVSVWRDTLAIGTARPVRIPITHRALESFAGLIGGHLVPCPAIARAVAAQTERPAPPRPFQDLRGMETLPRAIEYAAIVEGLVGPWQEHGAAIVGTLGKDYVNAFRLIGRPDRCAIFGWWAGATPIQPASTKHGIDYVDYSHAGRLVSRRCELDGAPADLAEIYADPKLSEAAGLRYGDPKIDGDGRLPVRHPGVSGKGIFA